MAPLRGIAVGHRVFLRPRQTRLLRTEASLHSCHEGFVRQEEILSNREPTLGCRVRQMAPSPWHKERKLLEKSGIELAPGLTETQLERVERVLQQRLPPDLRTMLSEFLPIGSGFPNWRDPESPTIRAWVNLPFEGVTSRVRDGLFWWSEWGECPSDYTAAYSLAQAQMQTVPRLCPVYGHRYIPLEPESAGNPVLSIVETDIIYHGNNLSAYLQHEFRRTRDERTTQRPPRRIRFWSDVIEYLDRPIDSEH